MRLTRVTLFFVVLILGLGFYQLVTYLLEDVEAQTLQATEEAMVDTANLLANYVEKDGELELIFNEADDRKFEARIFKILKSNVGMNAYLTDANGIIIFDSGRAENVGKNFIKWPDVFKTLKGAYGARSSRSDEQNASSSVMHVGAPVRKNGEIIGSLSVYKAQSDVLTFVKHRRKAIINATALIGVGILILIAAVFVWLFRPVGQLTDYARSITRGERRPKPEVGLGREVNTLANALHDMRESLEGRQYADQYIQTLTHELKSPLAAIQGAAELLNEEMPAAHRSRFLANIRSQTSRCQRLIHRLLELSALEAKTHLEHLQRFDLSARCQRSLDQLKPLAEAHRIQLLGDLPEHLEFLGNEALLGSALNHLLENAIQFSPENGEVTLTLQLLDENLHLSVADQGEGIADFARDRAFERFYSFRPENRGKGNGLGLAFVNEVALLHQGKAFIERGKIGGTAAGIVIPLPHSAR
ncbi:MAG: two-component system sensor histidine kinase CreC [Akkermansiaceae bacterium]|jgi:two-component system, OmpR family, sensor histidine kinase CreC